METGRYIISARWIGPGPFNKQPRKFLALLLVDVYGGFSKYHCTYRGGAIELNISSALKSKEVHWEILEVKMISCDQYRSEIERVNDVPVEEPKKSRQARRTAR